jgi:hypothetical protein
MEPAQTCARLVSSDGYRKKTEGEQHDRARIEPTGAPMGHFFTARNNIGETGRCRATHILFTIKIIDLS